MNWQEELASLERSVHLLLAEKNQLQQENRSLRTKLAELAQERATLLHGRDDVRFRVESMIHRLKSLENER
jgi:cell division protein ZapB